MNDLFLFASGAIIGYLFFKVYLSIKINKLFNLMSLEKTSGIAKQPQVFKLFIEEEQNTLYLYEYEKKEFLCQAKTIIELATLAKERNNIVYAAVIYKDDCVMFVNGLVKEVNES